MKEITARKYMSALDMLEDGFKPKVFHSSAKISQFFCVKDPVPQKYKSELVYKCTCPQIDQIKYLIFTNIVVRTVISMFGWTIFK